jgi:AcrR family transcriptional regulator
MVRPFRQQIDEGILDEAAVLFASRGLAKTSVQDVADAVGLSKAGLLHHFPSKAALHEAVLEQASSLGKQVLDQVQNIPLGTARDLRAVEAWVDIALAHPGLVALLLAPVTQGGAAATDAGTAALAAFGADPSAIDSERTVRVAGALAALVVLTLAANQHNLSTVWRPHIVATCFDALGHRRPGAPISSYYQAET